MLIYHPAFDIYHGVFRLLRILSISPKQKFEIERLRILDFYVLFPNELLKFTFPAALRSKKKQFQKDNPYQNINDPKRIFFRLEPYQISAIKCLVARQFVESELFLEGKICRTDNPLPDGLNTAIEKANKACPALIEMMNDSLLKIDLYGKSGLKGRSDLFEYRYDVTNTATSP